MPWARIDDGLYDHPKLDALGKDRLACVGLFTLALAWSNRYLTDGHIPSERVKRFGAPNRLADLLVSAGLWERVPDGFHIHDFLDFNESADAVRADREAARERMRVRRNNSGTSGEVQTPRARVSRPVPSVPINPPTPLVEKSKAKTGLVPLSEIFAGFSWREA